MVHKARAELRHFECWVPAMLADELLREEGHSATHRQMMEQAKTPSQMLSGSFWTERSSWPLSL